MWGHSRKVAICKPGSLHGEPKYPAPWHWPWTSQPPELCEVNAYCCSLSVCGVLLWQPELRQLAFHLLPCVCACMLSRFSCVWFFAAPRTVTRQAPLSMGFSKQEYWGGFPCPGDLPNPGVEPTSLTSPASAGGFFTTSATWEAQPSSLKHLSFPSEEFVPLTRCILVGWLMMLTWAHWANQSSSPQAWPLPVLAVQHVLPTGRSGREGGSLASVVWSQSCFQFEFSACPSSVSCCSGSIQSRLCLLQFPTIISVACGQRFLKMGSLVLGA